MENVINNGGTSTLSARRHVSEAMVRQIAAPERTETWVPIPHSHLIDEVDKALFELKLEVDPFSRKFGIQRDGGQMFGVYHIVNHDSSIVDANGKPIFSMAVGLINSTDKSLSAAVCFGSRVHVSDAVCMSGEKSIARKHTKNLVRDLPVLVREALSKFEAFKKYQETLFLALQDTYIEQWQAHDVLIKALKADAIPNAYIPRVLKEWDIPQHSDFRPRTAWSLFNAFTEIFKPAFEKNAMVASKRTIILTSLFQQEFVPNGVRMPSDAELDRVVAESETV